MNLKYFDIKRKIECKIFFIQKGKIECKIFLYKKESLNGTKGKKESMVACVQCCSLTHSRVHSGGEGHHCRGLGLPGCQHQNLENTVFHIAFVIYGYQKLKTQLSYMCQDNDLFITLFSKTVPQPAASL